MSFVQAIDIETDDIQPIRDHVNEWHSEQTGVAPGYRGTRILADEDRPGRYLIEVEFTSREEAEANNDRAETAAWAQKLEGLVEGSPTYANRSIVAATS